MGVGVKNIFSLKASKRRKETILRHTLFIFYFVVRRWIKIFGYATLGLCFTQPLLPSLSIIIKPFHSGAAFYLLQEEKGLFKGSTLNCIRSSRWSFLRGQFRVQSNSLSVKFPSQVLNLRPQNGFTYYKFIIGFFFFFFAMLFAICFVLFLTDVSLLFI